MRPSDMKPVQPQAQVVSGSREQVLAALRTASRSMAGTPTEARRAAALIAQVAAGQLSVTFGGVKYKVTE